MAENYYTQLTEQGIIQADTSTILAGVETDFQTAFGADIDLSPETPQGRFAELFSIERAGVLGINAANASQINLDYATGLFLDAIGANFATPRIGATSTRVLATITGTAGTVIPANSIAKSGENQFYAENAITIPVAGTIDAYFLSVNTGAIPCEIGTLTTIVSATFGWNTITNNSAATIGTAVEADGIYRTRIKNSRYNGNGFLPDVKTKLNTVPNILSSFAYDNGDSSPVVYDGITIAKNSVFVVADGGNDAAIAEAIFNSKGAGCGYTGLQGTGTVVFAGVGSDGDTVTVAGIVYRLKNTLSQSYDVKIGGTAEETATNLYKAINASGTAGVEYYTGTLANPYATATNGTSAQVDVTGGVYGQTLVSDTGAAITSTVTLSPQRVIQPIKEPSYEISYPVTFNRPAEIPIRVDIEVIRGGYSGSDLEAAIKSAIVSWAAGDVDGVDGLIIGQDVSAFEIASAVTILTPAPFIKTCFIGTNLGATATGTNITIDSKSVAKVVEANIHVTIS